MTRKPFTPTRAGWSRRHYVIANEEYIGREKQQPRTARGRGLVGAVEELWNYRIKCGDIER